MAISLERCQRRPSWERPTSLFCHAWGYGATRKMPSWSHCADRAAAGEVREEEAKLRGHVEALQMQTAEQLRALSTRQEPTLPTSVKPSKPKN